MFKPSLYDTTINDLDIIGYLGRNKNSYQKQIVQKIDFIEKKYIQIGKDVECSMNKNSIF